MTTVTDTTVSITRIISASPTDVFEAWTNPTIMAKWCAPEGIEHIECTTDLKVGGSYQLKMSNPEGGFHTAYGTYNVIERPHRLEYTWDWQEDDYKMGIATIIRVEFRPMGESTEVVLTHDLFPAREAADGHEQGWTSCLNRLEGLFS